MPTLFALDIKVEIPYTAVNQQCKIPIIGAIEVVIFNKLQKLIMLGGVEEEEGNRAEGEKGKMKKEQRGWCNWNWYGNNSIVKGKRSL